MGSPGRPSVYTEQLAAEICERRANGESLNAICAQDHMPAESTVRGWDYDDREGFSAKYARAIAIDTERELDRLRQIANEKPKDSVEATWQRTRLDHGKWEICKRMPRKYGEKLALGGDASAPPIQIATSNGPEIPPTTDLLAGIQKLGELAAEVLGDKGVADAVGDV